MPAKIIRVTNSAQLAPGWYYIPAVGQPPLGPYGTEMEAANAASGEGSTGSQPFGQPFV